jgi:hypothetical protein
MNPTDSEGQGNQGKRGAGRRRSTAVSGPNPLEVPLTPEEHQVRALIDRINAQNIREKTPAQREASVADSLPALGDLNPETPTRLAQPQAQRRPSHLSPISIRRGSPFEPVDRDEDKTPTQGDFPPIPPPHRELGTPGTTRHRAVTLGGSPSRSGLGQSSFPSFTHLQSERADSSSTTPPTTLYRPVPGPDYFPLVAPVEASTEQEGSGRGASTSVSETEKPAAEDRSKLDAAEAQGESQAEPFPDFNDEIVAPSDTSN